MPPAQRPKTRQAHESGTANNTDAGASAASNIEARKTIGASMKRKSPGSASIESGATPRTQRFRAGETNENATTNMNMLTLEEWAELHEFAAWLETLKATRIHKTPTQMDRELLQNWMAQPPTRATRQSAGPELRIDRERESPILWH